ncbi:hypothetical protein R3P38DRAFT_3374876, partial [Favolaschia claudopus]
MSTSENVASLPLNKNERESPSRAPESHTDAAVQTISDNERLIQVLQTGFSSLLQQQEEMSKAIADLKPKPPATTDKKTAFWNGYMTLANEYDKEFLQKYGTDLDTSLIFAGLFSAVASAFIIQIQPEFESAPHPLTVIAQSLLYISLGSTLLAALLAVLGKQWLMYYSAAGEQGTIERRGLERQRKLDGLIKWRFELIMQAFPLCLQFGLFLFAAALSVYLWRIHQVLAGIVIGITAGGAIAYFALLATAIFFKDSPFQTPLVPFLRTMVSSIVPRYLETKAGSYSRKCTLQFLELFKLRHIKQLFSPSFHQSEDLLPRFAFTLDSDPSAGPAPLFKKPIPSPENSGVSWVLEYSTDLTLLAQAADMSVDVQWPVNMDLTLKLIFSSSHYNWQGTAKTTENGKNSTLKDKNLDMSFAKLFLKRMVGHKLYAHLGYCHLKCSGIHPLLTQMQKAGFTELWERFPVLSTNRAKVKEKS